jgi:predicted AAA+ superfamily ATPase
MKLPKGQSTFFWGARKTGKSFYLKHHFPRSIYYDLLETDLYFRLLKEPHLFREEILALDKKSLSQPIIVDEIQKIPILLNEVHWLIENSSAYFILCGSSARKLKSEGVNLLGGRAWRYEFFPLAYPEIKDFDLLHALNFGLIPSHYHARNWNKTVKSYVNDYLKEEIKAEGLVRNLTAFAQFLDIAAFSNGETLNYANIARDCAVDAKTIKEYYQVLVDTLLGYYIFPYKDKVKREDLVASPKFYFFDVGVINRLLKRTIPQLKGAAAGNAFEHYIFMELCAYRGLNDLDFDIRFWRTNSGLEVDFILGNAEVAIEAKISDHIKSSDIHGLIAFQREYEPKAAIVVCTAPRLRKMTLPNGQTIDIMPWRTFLESLWNGEIGSKFLKKTQNQE